MIQGPSARIKMWTIIFQQSEVWWTYWPSNSIFMVWYCSFNLWPSMCPGCHKYAFCVPPVWLVSCQLVVACSSGVATRCSSIILLEKEVSSLTIEASVPTGRTSCDRDLFGLLRGFLDRIGRRCEKVWPILLARTAWRWKEERARTQLAPFHVTSHHNPITLSFHVLWAAVIKVPQKENFSIYVTLCDHVFAAVYTEKPTLRIG